jgi:hypothetical protein
MEKVEDMFPELRPPLPLVEYVVGACYSVHEKTLYLSVFNKTENMFQHEIKVFVTEEHSAPLFAEQVAKYFKTIVLYEKN